jgi:formate hydrogenlyase subunit 3/multisubunit Na+/H+ antiporter MnhD subunit
MTVFKFIAVIMNNCATPFIQSGVNLFYGAISTAESALLQQELSSEQRATMKSMVSVLGCIVRAIMYFCIGLVADIYSVWWAIMLLILINVFIGFGYYWMLKKYKQ